MLLRICNSFLTNRTQCVMIDGRVSDISYVTSGVPQGSVLGPLFFILYLNDLPSCLSVTNNLSCFADDAKLYKEIKNSSDFELLQSDLCNLSNWASDWQLEISIEKCSIVDIKSKKYKEQNRGNALNDITLETCLNKNDLGILIDKNLNFSDHIKSIAARGKQRVNLIFRVFKTKDIYFLLRGFNAYILPIVSYCSSVWSPYKICDILLIESVLRLFTRRLPGFEKLCYKERLAKLNLYTLEKRRLLADLILCFKLVTGVYNRPLVNYGLCLVTNGRDTRGHDLKLKFDKCRLDVRLNSFGPRVAKVWNCLPSAAVHASSVNVFKCLIRKIDFSKFLIINFVSK